MKTKIKLEKEEREKIGQNFAALIGLGLGGFIKKSKDLAFDLAKVKSALYYLKSVETVRQFFFGLFQIICSISFLFFGMAMIHLGVLMFLPFSHSIKALIILILGVIYVSTFLFVLFYLFSGDRWLKGAMKFNPLTEEVIKKIVKRNNL